MASLQITLQPFEIPEHVYVEVPGGGSVPVSLDELDEGTLAELVEEFAATVMAKAKSE